MTKKKPDDWQQVVIGDVRGKFVLDNEQSAAIQQLLNVSEFVIIVSVSLGTLSCNFETTVLIRVGFLVYRHVYGM